MDERNTRIMTILSQQAFSEATVKMNSSEEAVNFLKNELMTRSVRSNLEKFANGVDIKIVQKTLVEGLVENHPDMKRDSIERRVRGWLDPKSPHMIKKEDAIEIAFILRLGLEAADEFVAITSEEKLHWRDVEEIVYIYGLEHGLSYRACKEILEDPEVIEIQNQVNARKVKDEIGDGGYTEFVKKEVRTIHSQEKLINYLKENHAKLGSFHNTAYDMFMEMIGKLEAPSQIEEDLGLFEESEVLKKYTIRDIMADFLYQDVVLSAKQKAVKSKKDVKKQLISKEQQYTLDIIQKKISDSWPDEVSLSKMKNRKMDITRKCLILLFLATDGDYDEDEFDYDDYEPDGKEVFEDILGRLNDMLFFCGYSELDPRNPFDWLIIYCIYVEDMFDIDPRLLDVLEEVFRS